MKKNLTKKQKAFLGAQVREVCALDPLALSILYEEECCEDEDNEEDDGLDEPCWHWNWGRAEK